MAEQILPVTGDTTIPEPLQRQLERAREQGRREVYEALLAAPFEGNGPVSECSHACALCGAQGELDDDGLMTSDVTHRPDCLWLRARAAVAGE